MHSRSLLLPKPQQKTHLIADFCVKDRGPVRKKPKSECIFRLCPNAFSCVRFDKVQKEHAALHMWKARPNAFFRPGKMHSAASGHPCLFGYPCSISALKTNETKQRKSKNRLVFYDQHLPDMHF